MPRVRTIDHDLKFSSDTDRAWASSMNVEERRRAFEVKLAQEDRFGRDQIKAVFAATPAFFADFLRTLAVNLAVCMLGVFLWGCAEMDAIEISSYAGTLIRIADSAGIAVAQAFFRWLGKWVGGLFLFSIEVLIIASVALTTRLTTEYPGTETVGVLLLWSAALNVLFAWDTLVLTNHSPGIGWANAGAFNYVSRHRHMVLFAVILVVLDIAEKFTESLVMDENSDRCAGECQAILVKTWLGVILLWLVASFVAFRSSLIAPEPVRHASNMQHEMTRAGDETRNFPQSQPEGHVDQVPQIQNLGDATVEFLASETTWVDPKKQVDQWMQSRKAHLATALSWFLFTTALYNLGFDNMITVNTAKWIWTRGTNPHEVFYCNAVGNLVSFCLLSIPGSLITAMTIDILRRKAIARSALAILIALHFVVGTTLGLLFASSNERRLVLYVIAQFPFSYGSRPVASVVKTGSLPARHRSASHSISAAVGSISAIVVQHVFDAFPTADVATGSPWGRLLVYLFGGFFFCGVVTTWFASGTTPDTIEVLVAEDADAYTESESGSDESEDSEGGSEGSEENE
ncbi:hypothetical protein PDE_01359 [Penicillium oxalicum 114-2]|uniref:Major facilitator superfamily (MFS) profile domain-containing protein n=1 Tax=Penicillium oxalicum (strain 114-2 / CGMCC 5302) TaxID=933388 RepID=S8AKS4_PENO1|nr:hypothetical protein PDE_01359 [Penicillium oxalicum 114-2]